MKNFKEIQKLAIEANEKVMEIIMSEAKKRDVILFNPETIDNDAVYDFPFVDFVSRHGFHVAGVVQKLSGDNMTMFHTGEEFGETTELPITDLLNESAIIILDYL